MSPTIPAAPAAAPPPAAAPGSQPAAPPPAQPNADLDALRKELDTVKGQVAEHQRATQFWYEKATKGGDQNPAAAKPAAEDDDTDLLDLITTRGSKGLREYLQKSGFTSKEEVDQLVNTKAASLTKEQELIREYPDLAPDKRDSDFFKATASEYGRLKNDGVPEHLAMEQAARNTELRFLREGKMQTPGQKKQADAAERERKRLERVAAQGGDRGGRGSEPDDETDETVTPEEERIIKGMLVGQPGKDGKPMNYDQALDAFKARAKAGVQVQRRRR